MSESLDNILDSYKYYYDIEKDLSESPFYAKAEFHSHNEQYFLTRKAQISEMDSHEFVYFIEVKNLNFETIKKLSKTAWEMGLQNVIPSSTHRNSDIVLIILTDKIDEDIKDLVNKIKYSKNYKFSLFGWSNFQLIVKNKSTNELFFNKYAKKHKNMYYKILK